MKKQFSNLLKFLLKKFISFFKTAFLLKLFILITATTFINCTEVLNILYEDLNVNRTPALDYVAIFTDTNFSDDEPEKYIAWPGKTVWLYFCSEKNLSTPPVVVIMDTYMISNKDESVVDKDCYLATYKVEENDSQDNPVKVNFIIRDIIKENSNESSDVSNTTDGSWVQIIKSGEFPTAVFDNNTLPNQETINLDVGIKDDNLVADYRYKLITPGRGDNCSKEEGYSIGWTSQDTHIVNSLNDDGEYTLCVVGRDINEIEQPIANPTMYTWTKVTGEVVVTTTELAGNIDFYQVADFTLLFDNVIAGTWARGGGEVFVINNDALPITERGLCWNTTGNPGLLDQCVSDGSGEGIFTTVMMTGLSEDEVYHVRAYAVHASGTTFGNEITFNSGLEFGTYYKGGLVFYNDGFGSGLVALENDIGPKTEWSNVQNYVETSQEVGSGLSNSLEIIFQDGHTTSLAENCLYLMRNGYDDWFQPSQHELILMYHHLKVSQPWLFDHAYYFSSSQNIAAYTHAYQVNFTNGNSSSVRKTTLRYTRATRIFDID